MRCTEVAEGWRGVAERTDMVRKSMRQRKEQVWEKEKKMSRKEEEVVKRKRDETAKQCTPGGRQGGEVGRQDFHSVRGRFVSLIGSRSETVSESSPRR